MKRLSIAVLTLLSVFAVIGICLHDRVLANPAHKTAKLDARTAEYIAELKLDAKTAKFIGEQMADPSWRRVQPGEFCFNMNDPETGAFLGRRVVINDWSNLSPDMQAQRMADVARGVYKQLAGEKHLDGLMSRMNDMKFKFVSRTDKPATMIAPSGGVSTEGKPMIIGDPGVSCVNGTERCSAEVCGVGPWNCDGAATSCARCG